ncbi:hypothetical protein [Arenimonas sp.]|uniref:hypothetical protein n=1 Tax=Arenimonas sp. TaxID=1872635 RepID=UPI002E378EC4|nr:hypothetical protein [Arenimonas sp.]HEX4853964.1 hypothetical protein [Arenimonas sp.]
MKVRSFVLFLALAASLCASDATAGDADERKRLSRQLVERWSPHVEEAHEQPGAQWSGEMAPLLQAVPMAQLRAAAASSSFEGMNDALLGKATPEGDGGSTQGFGDIDTDLLYVPVTPCRILDTRVAGGQILANSARGFDVTSVSSYAGQGGSGTNCGVGDQGSFAAAVINFTVVNPSAAGFITAYPVGVSQPMASTLNYAPGSVVGNLAVVRLDQGIPANEMSVYTFAQTHLVADIVGYFRNASQPVTECVNTAFTIINVDPGAGGNAFGPNCPAGYTETSTRCQTGSFDMPLVYMDSGTCSARNNSSAVRELRAGRTCCRVTIP